ncbi:TonB family protein [Dinghuibacter silviterrae]|uniref:TonB family protein n=1 Tax=Dinghuibacter silviterrae TaxID=1539049 RepID=A0A4R8DHX6_9BACT|nr:TonB family protein [Dinghuibacter silviterrae]TDW96550.1 TonB family protein [Dinghuibacter silviterrae]
MFKKESDKTIFTAEDIERYHQGLMTPAERHALEKAALEDPFLEEALEGFAGLPPGQASKDLSILRQRLAARVHRNRGLGVWWRAAAVVVVMAGAGGLAYRYWWAGSPEKRVAAAQKAPLAQKVAPPATPGASHAPEGPAPTTPERHAPAAEGQAPVVPRVQAPKTEASGVKNPAAAATAAAPKAQAQKPRTAAAPAQSAALLSAAAQESRAVPPVAAPTTAARRPAAPAAPQAQKQEAKAFDTLARGVDVTVTGNVAPAADTSYVTMPHAGNATTVPAGNATMALARNANALDIRIRGVPDRKTYFQNHITDVFNQPISYASIRVLPSGREWSADQNGFFRLGTTDTATKVLVTAVGYAPRQFNEDELKNLPSLQLILDTAQLDKVVVVGMGTKKSKPDLPDTTGAEPLEGWSNYNDYLTNNIQMPDEALQNHIHGYVHLTFQVDATGKPTNVSVTKSLCNPCDAEAVRLLLQGPNWKKAKEGKKVKGKLKVHF